MALEYPELAVATAEEWSQWLDRNHDSAPGVWLRLAKKNSGAPGPTYLEALEHALCYGWIDGQIQGSSGPTFLQKFTPRRKGSPWSKINRDRVIALEAAGRMKPAGLAEVEKAKANGRWDAAYSSAAPPEVEAALAGNPTARKLYEQLDSRNRTAIHYRVGSLRKPENRVRKAEEFITMLARGEKPFG